LSKEDFEVLQQSYKTDYEAQKIGTHVNVSPAGDVLSRFDVRATAILASLDLERVRHRTHLDIGAGSGEFSSALLRNGGARWISHAHEMSKARHEQLKIAGCERRFSGPIRRIKGRYDLITLFHVLEHVRSPVQLLRDAKSLLTPAGTLVCVVPSFECVNSDFFISEHLHHFQQSTLSLAAELAGLSLQDHHPPFLAANEIGFTARPRDNRLARAEDAIAYAESLPDLIAAYSGSDRPIGLFGLAGTGQWLAKLSKKSLSFFVDEDPTKIGRRFVGLPILSPDKVPPGSLVLVLLNNAKQSTSIARRLRSTNPHFETITPADDN
jgi:SAM-dependent methyltransferase